MEKHTSNIFAKSFKALFKRFHLMLFFVFIVACLAGAVIMLNKILTESSDTTDYTSSISAGSIDQQTLNAIQSLHTSTVETPLPAVPQGRINAFAE